MTTTTPETPVELYRGDLLPNLRRAYIKRNSPGVKKIAGALQVGPFRGIQEFHDVGPLLADPRLFRETCCRMAAYCLPLRPDVVAGVDARGFVFGPTIAQILDVPFVMVRKEGKLPNAVTSSDYHKEYVAQTESGSDRLCVQKDKIRDGQRVVIVDDLIATGGTLVAAEEVVRAVGGIPVGNIAVVILSHLLSEKTLQTLQGMCIGLVEPLLEPHLGPTSLIVSPHSLIDRPNPSPDDSGGGLP
jgi:adenine phosphoribosyltransferase